MSPGSESIERVEKGWRRELDRRPFISIQDGANQIDLDLVFYGRYKVAAPVVRYATGAAMIGVSIFLFVWVFFLW